MPPNFTRHLIQNEQLTWHLVRCCGHHGAPPTISLSCAAQMAAAGHNPFFPFIIKQVAAQWLKCTIIHVVDNCIV